MERKKRGLQSEEFREQIEEDFEEIHNRLRDIEKLYNPSKLNLHFDDLRKCRRIG